MFRIDNEDFFNEKLETFITRPFIGKKVTLYHGSQQKLDVIEPKTINAGTRLSKPRMSSFWCMSMSYPLYFLIYDIISDICIKKLKLTKYNCPLCPVFIDYKGENEKLNVYILEDYYEAIIKYLKNSKGYIYIKTVDRKLVGRGHHAIHNEYTLDVPVKPDKVITITYDDIKDMIKVVSESELKELYKHEDSIIKTKGFYWNDRKGLDFAIYRSHEKSNEIRKMYKNGI